MDFGPKWYPSAELRFVTPDHTTTKPRTLQQLWTKDKINALGHVSGHDEEWRDVPLVVLPTVVR